MFLQVFAESIFHLVRDRFTELSGGSCPASHTRHKFLAGIVMTRGEWSRNTNTFTRKFLVPGPGLRAWFQGWFQASSSEMMWSSRLGPELGPGGVSGHGDQVCGPGPCWVGSWDAERLPC